MSRTDIDTVSRYNPREGELLVGVSSTTIVAEGDVDDPLVAGEGHRLRDPRPQALDYHGLIDQDIQLCSGDVVHHRNRESVPASVLGGASVHDPRLSDDNPRAGRDHARSPEKRENDEKEQVGLLHNGLLAKRMVSVSLIVLYHNLY